MLSIIIPTLNEQNYLPYLLASLSRQTFQDFEVIVADADSKDRTREIAKNFGCRIIKGGLPGSGRNNGAKAAKNEWLLFLDADVILPPYFLERAMKEIKKRNLKAASCNIKPLSDKKIDKFLHNTVNLYFKGTERFWPHAPGFCIFVKKEIHQKINGFDEKIKLAEDHDYIMRASKIAPFRYLKSVKIPVSVRRLEKDGRFKIALKYALAEAHLIFLGPITSNIFNYKFDQFN